MTNGFIKDIEPFFYRRSMIYVDVGAHNGTVFQRFAKSGLSIREAHLIEPNPGTFALLERAVEQVSGVRLCFCHNLALGAGEERLRLRNADSMTKVIEAGAPEGDLLGMVAPDAAFDVAATTLDTLSTTFERRHISILKIDVEGYEPKVLEGARGLLCDQAIDVIYVEAGLHPGMGQQSYYRVIEDFLGQHRYRLFRIYEQVHEWIDDNPLLRRMNMAFMSDSFAEKSPYRLSRELFDIRKEKAAIAERSAMVESEVMQLRSRVALAESRTAKTAAALQVVESERNAQMNEIERLRREASDSRAYARKLERKYEAVLASTSWRITAPIRRMIQLATRRPASKPFSPLPGSSDTAAGKSSGKNVRQAIQPKSANGAGSRSAVLVQERVLCQAEEPALGERNETL